MGERYLVTGVQLGMLIALPTQADREELVNNIIDNQHIGSSEEDVKTDIKQLSKYLTITRTLV
jgi:hypothetical protein